MLPLNVHFNRWSLLLALVLVGCRSPAPSTVIERSWPPPPAEARIQYLGAATQPTELGARVSFWNKVVNTVTGSRRGREPWVRPFGMSVDEQGQLCLTDPGTARVAVYDPQRKSFTQWQRVGGVPFNVPVAIAKRGSTLYVADTGGAEVIAFNLKGKLLFTIKDPLQRPSGLLLYGDILLVADSKAHCLHAFDLEGTFLRSYGRRGEGLGEYNFPTHLASDAQGQVYVTDSMNFRIQVLDSGFRAIRSIGKLGQASGQFSRPKGVAVDKAGHVYVTDALFDNVQVFDATGQFLMHWGEAGQSPGSFWMPAGIAIDQHDTIYVADSYNQRIQQFQYKELP